MKQSDDSIMSRDKIIFIVIIIIINNLAVSASWSLMPF